MQMLLAIVGLLLSGCAQSNSQISVAAFGDSLTERDGSYVLKLQDKFGWKLANHAVGGTQMKFQKTKVLEADLSGVDFAILFVGYNDMRNNGLDQQHLNDFKSDLKIALQYLDTRGIPVYLGTCLRMVPEYYNTWAPGNLGSDEAAYAYSAAMLELVNEIGSPRITVVDVTNKFIPLPELYDDKVHPTSAGTERLFEIFKEAIETRSRK